MFCQFVEMTNDTFRSTLMLVLAWTHVCYFLGSWLIKLRRAINAKRAFCANRWNWGLSICLIAWTKVISCRLNGLLSNPALPGYHTLTIAVLLSLDACIQVILIDRPALPSTDLTFFQSVHCLYVLLELILTTGLLVIKLNQAGKWCCWFKVSGFTALPSAF